jgi:hypothetical protein
MEMTELRSIAINIGIKPGKLNKEKLIKTIQRQEGNFDCFATAVNSFCDQDDCLWRKDCFASIRKGAKS